ncbi:MAG TPA: 4Fe-4S dicluster domain-containing protein [Candidatus Marinimicrobia bacterium]|nr:4Fe-4S dicluster domain-containing protein [Candidatus Neomarinimicrobiota bacterium]
MVERKIVLRFPSTLVDQPVVCKLAKDFDLEFNILKAYVTPDEEGMLVIELRGKEDNYNRGLEFLKKKGIVVQSLRQKITRNDEKCVHCGACVVVCPVGALVMDYDSKKVNFIEDSCIACEHCVLACPTQAMETRF